MTGWKDYMGGDLRQEVVVFTKTVIQKNETCICERNDWNFVQIPKHTCWIPFESCVKPYIPVSMSVFYFLKPGLIKHV